MSIKTGLSILSNFRVTRINNFTKLAPKSTRWTSNTLKSRQIKRSPTRKYLVPESKIGPKNEQSMVVLQSLGPSHIYINLKLIYKPIFSNTESDVIQSLTSILTYEQKNVKTSMTREVKCDLRDFSIFSKYI